MVCWIRFEKIHQIKIKILYLLLNYFLKNLVDRIFHFSKLTTVNLTKCLNINQFTLLHILKFSKRGMKQCMSNLFQYLKFLIEYFFLKNYKYFRGNLRESKSNFKFWGQIWWCNSTFTKFIVSERDEIYFHYFR